MRRTRLKSIGRVTLRKRTKMGNIRTPYDGHNYHSKLEAHYAQQLDLRMHAAPPMGISAWRPQVPVKLEVSGHLICTYIVDFLITHLDGHEEWIECKGKDMPLGVIKMKLFRALFPDRKLTVVR